ncbi:hypothetical protein EVAR_15960_1 [Eumeta japonica]|uniref:Uncharacterized protein n=1 Tax=Eumeta variegata TaxID=151549 RepID=A0A4C1UM61_EUMVA|nr:hypothetical protein EVAR_15960_1 [Eumeta japonica]
MHLIYGNADATQAPPLDFIVKDIQISSAIRIIACLLMCTVHLQRAAISRIEYGLEVGLAFLTRKKCCKRSQMTQVFPFVELKKEREYPKAQHIVFYKEPKCIRFTNNEYKVFSLEIILKGFHFEEQCYRIIEIPNSSKILWSDESTFKKDGYINLHNFDEWHVKNSHLMREDRSQYRFKVNLWTGILNGKIIGPFELPENLNCTNYLNFLRENLPTLLEDVPLVATCGINKMAAQRISQCK